MFFFCLVKTQDHEISTYRLRETCFPQGCPFTSQAQGAAVSPHWWLQPENHRFLLFLLRSSAHSLSWYQVALHIYICIKNYIKPCISAQHEAISPCPLCKRKMLHVVRLWLPQASWKLSVFAPFWWHPSFFSRVGAPLMLTYAPCHSPSLLSSGRVLGKQETFRSHWIILWLKCVEGGGRWNKMCRQNLCTRTVISGTRHPSKQIHMSHVEKQKFLQSTRSGTCFFLSLNKWSRQVVTLKAHWNGGCSFSRTGTKPGNSVVARSWHWVLQGTEITGSAARCRVQFWNEGNQEKHHREAVLLPEYLDCIRRAQTQEQKCRT